MNTRNRNGAVAAIVTTIVMTVAGGAAQEKTVKIVTLDPGHFHAALVQKVMYEGVAPVVHVYAPAGPDLDLHLARIKAFNTRAENPTKWETKVYTGEDYLEKLLKDHAGNVVVISGNNAKKAEYILRCVEAGFNVLADKPMAITPDDEALLKKAFRVAKKNGVLLYDIMTERFEITTILQKEFSLQPELFGEMDKGTPEDPSITKESVHYFFKYVAGSPLQRPPWFFDSAQQGDAIVDVTTHLTDLVQWECFPGQVLKEKDAVVLSARRWTTPMTPAQFTEVTKVEKYPEYLKRFTDKDGVLQVDANGEFLYRLKGIHAKISVRWGYQAPEGAGDTHYSLMRGTRASLIIRQAEAQKYKPTLYIEPRGARTPEEMKAAVDGAVAKVAAKWPGISVKKVDSGWEVQVPDEYKLGHEAHFGQVTENFLKYLATGQMPAWEVPNMLVKYHTLMQAYRMSHSSK